MKKFFLLSAVASMAMAANAQQQAAFIDAEALGIGSDKVAVTGGTVLASSENVTMKAAYDCEYKAVAMDGEADPFKTITIDGTVYADLATGIQGQANPTNAKNANTQQPKDNAVFQFDVTADGMLYVFSKFSGNKQYYAFEGAYTAETPSSSIVYTIVAGNQVDSIARTATLPGNEEGFADYSSYAPAETIGAPFLCELLGMRDSSDENYGTNAGWSDAQKANMLGVGAFKVYAEAGTYYFMAVGSKITCDGFVFIPAAEALAEVTVTAGEASLSNVAAGKTAAITYNILGQQVPANTKGLVIRNGKKIINF